MKADKIGLRNPAWNSFVGNVAIKAAQDLGAKTDAGAVEANLVRARLWAADACMSPHRR